MTRRLSDHARSADLISMIGRPEAGLVRAADRAGIELRSHMPDGEVKARIVKLGGQVVILHVAKIDAAAQLLLAEIRRTVHVQIIVLAETLCAETRILALLHGADHVLRADADERELAAILTNATRRFGNGRAVSRAGEERHRWHLERERWVLIAPNEREIWLSRSEFAILDILIGHAGIVQSRALLRAAIDGDPNRERVLDVVISRLRRKVWDCAGMELPLRSARSSGYVFAGVVVPRLSS